MELSNVCSIELSLRNISSIELSNKKNQRHSKYFMNNSMLTFYKDLIKNATNKQDKFLKFFYSSRSHVAVILHVSIFSSKPKASLNVSAV